MLVKTVHRHSLCGFAVYTRTEKPGLPETVKLATLLKDHLGSTDVILTGKWNGSAFAADVETERQSFDPWGERRDPGTFVTYRQTDTDSYRTSAQDYDRGYTGHEQLDDSGLIHMNGRIYDPELGRMLSPDPFVQVPEYSQNFNRYSYVLNNPLNATDPTGYSWISDAFSSVGSWFKENWRQVVVIVVVAVITIVSCGSLTGGALAMGSVLLGGTATAAVTASVGAWAVAAIGGAFLGGITGGLSAALAGGDLGDVLLGATIGGISGAITSGGLHAIDPGSGGLFTNPGEAAIHIAGHGVVGGATNVAMGGKFQDGFYSAAASAAAADAGLIGFGGDDNLSVAARTTMAGIVGGTASVIGGGKFANGAFTAAFQHYLNSEGGTQLKKAFFVGHDFRSGPGGQASYNQMIESARSAGYEVHPDAYWSSVKSAWESREYAEIVYFNHGSESGGLSYDVPTRDGRGYAIGTSRIDKMFSLNSGFASKLTIVSCYYDKVTKPFIDAYKSQGVNIATLPIEQVRHRAVFVIGGKPVDAAPGYIMRDKAIGGLASYFQAQKR